MATTTAPAPERTVKFPDEAPTDRQLWLIAQLVRQLKPKKRPGFPYNRLEASQTIARLKKQQ